MEKIHLKPMPLMGSNALYYNPEQQSELYDSTPQNKHFWVNSPFKRVCRFRAFYNNEQYFPD